MNIFLFIIGLIGGIYFYTLINNAVKTDNWVTIHARLDLLETPSYTKMVNQTYREFKTINVSYSYNYKHINYTSNQLSLVNLGTMRGHQVDAFIAKHKWVQGENIIIYVNPNNPSESTMLGGTKGVGKDTWISFYFCLLLMISGLVGCLRSLYQYISEPIETMSHQE